VVSGPRLILILGDQLSRDLPSLVAADPARDVVVMAEVFEEASYAPHHVKKLAFVFSAMRHFAQDLRADGWRVDYARLDDPDPAPSIEDAMTRAIVRHSPAGLVCTEPGEWRLQRVMEGWTTRLDLPCRIFADTRFLCARDAFAEWAEGRKSLRMEYFYREMRRAHDLLMQDGDPVGGAWNFDAENRKKAPRDAVFPSPLKIAPDAITEEVLAMVEARFPESFGVLRPFWFAVTARDAARTADHFMANALPGFGDVQDAMVEDERFLNHSVLGQYLNAGLLNPLDLCRRAEAAYRAGDAPLNAVEGYVRQILGWREFMRGIYWREGEDYIHRNVLGATRALPEFYWTGDTDMACMKAAIDQTRTEAYAHHIQRLMVTGNFALLAGVNPHQVHEWYLGVYADAYEWVEAPNVIGMSQFADGGIVGSKPYAASGAYIDRMSDHCRGCRYDVKKKSGPDACPMNPLYWDFMLRHRDRFASNPRVARAYSTWDRMAEDTRAASRLSAAAVLARLDAGERI
jgi:deoxyribodipyrimidine photolyase-related protein